MAYRDDREGLRLRVEELETKLAASEQTVARLRGSEDAAAAPAPEIDRVTGAPTRLQLTNRFYAEVTDEGYEAIASLLDKRIPGGHVSVVGRTLTHRKASYELRMTRTAGGSTELQLQGDYRAARWQLILGGPGLAVIAMPLAAAAAMGLGLGPVGAAVGVVVAFVCVVAGLRALMQRQMARDRALLMGVFEAVADLAQAHAKPARQRIDPAAATEEEEIVERAASDELEEADANAESTGRTGGAS